MTDHIIDASAFNAYGIEGLLSTDDLPLPKMDDGGGTRAALLT
jgi:hypothetical protein